MLTAHKADALTSLQAADHAIALNASSIVSAHFGALAAAAAAAAQAIAVEECDRLNVSLLDTKLNTGINLHVRILVCKSIDVFVLK